MVEIVGQGSIDVDQLGGDTAFPVLPEFSFLISLLSRASTGLPYVLGPVELLGLIGGLDDLDDREDDGLF